MLGDYFTHLRGGMDRAFFLRVCFCFSSISAAQDRTMIEIKAPEAYLAGVDRVGRATKVEWFEEILALLTQAMTDQVQPVLVDVYDTHVAIYGDEVTDEWNETLAEAYAAEVPEYLRGLISEGFPFVDYITAAIVGRVVGDWKAEWASKPGQFLAKFGVVASDYTEAPEPNAAPVKPVIAIPEPAVTREQVAEAWQWFTTATTVDQAELARELGISRSTVSNYGVGKTQGKCTAAQAAILANECFRRAADLQAAGGIFANVK